MIPIACFALAPNPLRHAAADDEVGGAGGDGTTSEAWKAVRICFAFGSHAFEAVRLSIGYTALARWAITIRRAASAFQDAALLGTAQCVDRQAVRRDFIMTQGQKARSPGCVGLGARREADCVRIGLCWGLCSGSRCQASRRIRALYVRPEAGAGFIPGMILRGRVRSGTLGFPLLARHGQSGGQVPKAKCEASHPRGESHARASWLVPPHGGCSWGQQATRSVHHKVPPSEAQPQG